LISERFVEMTDEKSNMKTTTALYFDGKDETKWDAWAFKMLAYASKKGHKEAFLTKFKYGADESKWTEVEKANKKFESAAWSQLAMVVQGHALKSVIKVTSENPKEAWDKLKAEFEPTEIADVVGLMNEFAKLVLETETENPIEWIEKLELNNERVGKIQPRYLKDDFLMIAHIFAMLPKELYKTYVTSEKKTVAVLTMIQMKKNVKEF
jgi:hypothetical protein